MVNGEGRTNRWHGRENHAESQMVNEPEIVLGYLPKFVICEFEPDIST